VSILTALDIVREVVDNSIFKREIDKHGRRDHAGRQRRATPCESRVFPSVAVNMIAIGEETGRLPGSAAPHQRVV
jgi:general secretion pathway protein F